MKCSQCKNSRFDKGFPECHSKRAARSFRGKNYKYRAYKLNAFKNCEYFEKKWFLIWVKE